MKTPRPWHARRAARPALAIVWLLCLASAACASDLGRTDAALYPPPPADAITFWGHACCYIDVGGYGVVTDPVFEMALVTRRRKAPIPPPADYARTRVILISHAHPDHLSPATLATFPDSALVLCPAPAVQYMKDVRQPVRALRPGDEFQFPGGTIIAVTAHHPGTRLSLDAEADGRALGYILRTPQATIYYSGDTDLFPGIGVIGARYQPTLALLNVNGHLPGEDAVRAAQALGARTIVPLHWGVFGYLWMDARREPRDLGVLRAQLGAAVVPIALGGSMPLTGPTAAPAPAPAH